eukprot:Skav202588  [mRNA]  locus=scaffold1305:98737:99844:+ [translate_table: standard]
MAKELIVVRLVLDTPPETVAAALDKALLHGQPGLLKQEALPLPDPISARLQILSRKSSVWSRVSGKIFLLSWLATAHTGGQDVIYTPGPL